MQAKELRERCEKFYGVLTDNQAIVFSLYFSLNDYGIGMCINKISEELNMPYIGVKNSLIKSVEYLNLPYFKPIAEAINIEINTLNEDQ